MASSQATQAPVLASPGASEAGSSRSANSLRDSVVPFIAGALGGSLAAAILSPLDIVRTRLQSAQLAARKPPPYALFLEIVRTEGPLALYRGLVPTIIGVGPSRALYFGGYSFAKKEMGVGGLGLSGTPLDLLASAAAGVFTNTLMSPWWVIRLRLQLQHTPITPLWRRHRADGVLPHVAGGGAVAAAVAPVAAVAASAPGLPPEGYRGIADCASRILREEGWRAFYRGLTASYLGVVETAVQFGLYGEMKRVMVASRLPLLRQQYADEGRALPSEHQLRREAYTDSLAFGASATTKLIASVLTYPHEVVRTRMREQHSSSIRYSSIVQTVRTILREESVRGLYGGLTVHLVRTVPNAVILLVVVEKLVGGSV